MDAFCSRLIGVFFRHRRQPPPHLCLSLAQEFGPKLKRTAGQLAEVPDWKAFVDDKTRPRIAAGHVTYLRPGGPVPWMRALFDPIDWSNA